MDDIWPGRHMKQRGVALRRFVSLAGLVAALSGGAPVASAGVALQVSALRGGSMIDLGEVGAGSSPSHEEVTIRVTNETGGQYRITQGLSQPLMNERGSVIDPSTVFMELSGGESGTVRFTGAAPLQDDLAELFVSGPSGEPDSLRLIYSVPATERLQAGAYAGAVTYTVQAIDGSALDAQTLPIRLVVYPTVMLSPAAGFAGRVAFGSLEPGEGSGAQGVTLLVAGSAGGPLELVHRLDEPLMDDQGRELSPSALMLRVTGEGALVSGEQPLEPVMRVWQRGESTVPAGHRVELLYRVVAPESQPAGWYRGLVHLELEGSAGRSGERASLDLPLELEVLPIMELSVESERASTELAFGALEPGASSRSGTLAVRVRANTGRPYEVHQELTHRLVNDDGRQLPEAAMRCALAALDGAPAGGAMQPLPAGRSPVYRSDERGSPARLALACELQVPPDAAGGVYRSQLVFTVTSF